MPGSVAAASILALDARMAIKQKNRTPLGSTLVFVRESWSLGGLTDQPINDLSIDGDLTKRVRILQGEWSAVTKTPQLFQITAGLAANGVDLWTDNNAGGELQVVVPPREIVGPPGKNLFLQALRAEGISGDWCGFLTWSIETVTPQDAVDDTLLPFTPLATTLLTSLSRSYDNNAQVVVGDNHWEGGTPLNNTGDTIKNARTNAVLSSFKFAFTDKEQVGVKFNIAMYSTTEVLSGQSHPIVVQPGGTYAARLIPGGPAGMPEPWTFGIRPTTSAEGTVLFKNIPPGSYVCELVRTHINDARGRSVSFSYEREVEIVVGTEMFDGYQIDALIGSSSGTWDTINDTRTALSVDIHSDSRLFGFIPPVDQNDLLRVNLGTGNVPGVDYFDTTRMGALAHYAYRLAVDLANARGKRLKLTTNGYGGLWLSNTDPFVRYYYETILGVGLAADWKDRRDQRTAYVNGEDGSGTGVVASRPFAGSKTYDVIIVDLGTNDQALAVNDPAGAYRYWGVPHRDDFVTNINSMKSAHASAKIFVMLSQRTDASMNINGVSHVDCHARELEALGAGVGMLNAAADANLDYFDVSTAGIVGTDSGHPPISDHTIAYQKALPQFLALVP